MIAPAQFAARWGEQGLVRATPQALADVRIPDESKAFLIQAGLPGEAEGVGLSFSLPPDRLPTLREVLAAEGRPAPARLERYRRIGSDYDAHLCLDQAKGGHVVSVSVEPKLQVAFVNSSVPQLAEFLLRFRDLRRSLQGAEREAMRTVVEETRRDEEAPPEQREAGDGPLQAGHSQAKAPPVSAA